MSYKIILVKTDEYSCDCYGDGCGGCYDPPLEMTDVTVGDLARVNHFEIKSGIPKLIPESIRPHGLNKEFANPVKNA